jgi:hypothetical protein
LPYINQGEKDMPDIEFRIRATKKRFEGRLVKDFGTTGLTKGQYVEDGQRMTLYSLNGMHIGTWTNGTGWVFTKAYAAAV